MTVDALAPHVNMSSAAIILTTKEVHVLDSKMKDFNYLCHLNVVKIQTIFCFHHIKGEFIEAVGHIYMLAQHNNIVSGNGLSPVQHQAIILTNAVMLSIRP